MVTTKKAAAAPRRSRPAAATSAPRAARAGTKDAPTSEAKRARAHRASGGTRAAARDEAADVFLSSVRAQDFPAEDLADAWANTSQFAMLTLALVGASPSKARTRAVLGLFRHAADLLETTDRAAANDAVALLETAIRATEVQSKNRAAFELAERRDVAISAKRPALAAFTDGLSHAAEAVASHAEGHTASPPRRGMEAGRSLLFAVAEVRTGDGENLDARKAAGRDLAVAVRRMLPGGPWA